MNIVDPILEYGYLILYAITLGIALWRYPRYFDTVFKYLPILLMYTFITELGGNIIRLSEEFDLVLTDLLDYNNWVIYNIYDIIFFLYFFYVYWSTIKKENYRKFVLIGAILYVIAVIVNASITDFITVFQLGAYIIGAIFLITTIFLYFNYLKSISGKWFVSSNLLSWLSIGMLIFFMGYLPIIILSHFRIVEGEDYIILRRFHLFLILVMYSCFILGFKKMSRRSLIT